MPADMPKPAPKRARKAKRPPRIVSVTEARHLTPNMIRVTLTGEFIAGLDPAAAGANCKVFLPAPGQSRDAFAAQLDAGPSPSVRTYTVRHVRPGAREMDIDFVDHGDLGPASAWARAATPGAFCGFSGPGQAKITSFHADFYLIAADMSAIPVAAATLEAMPRNARGLALFEITSEADRQEIDAPPGIEMRWLVHPDPHVESRQAVEAVAALAPFAGTVQTCIAGEHSVIRALREEIVLRRGVPKENAYISGYWKIGLVEDEHQAMKRNEAA